MSVRRMNAYIEAQCSIPYDMLSSDKENIVLF